MSETPDELLQVLPLYRELGFFAGHAALTDAQLAAELREQYRAGPSRLELKTDFPGWDLALLDMDESRTWEYDSESVYRDDKVYAELIERLGRISRDTFQPTDIAEDWDGDLGPIHVRFRLHGQQHQIDLDEMEGDFMDSNVLRYVEPLIQASTPYELVHLCTGDQTDCIVLLSPEERDRLKAERPALFDFEGAYGMSLGSADDDEE